MMNFQIKISLNLYKKKSSAWILDSGCTNHMIYDQTMFAHSRPIKSRIAELPKVSMTQVTDIGTIVLSPDLILDNVLCIPYFHLNLISICKFTCNSSHIAFFLNKHFFV